MFPKWKNYSKVAKEAGINPHNQHQWHISKDAESTAEAAADFIAQAIRQTLELKPQCLIALPGGNTPVKCLQLLAKMDLPWRKCHWFLGDERCYPVGHPERNDTMIRASFLNHIDTDQEHFHPIPAELGAEQAAQEYSHLLQSFGPLDIAFLGMGEDGHTASLFPDNPALNNKAAAVAVFNAPKAPEERVSLSSTSLQSAKIRMVLATGVAKQSILKQIKNNAPLPINNIGDIHWFIDLAANGN